MDNTEILSILHKLGDRVPPNSRLVLVGGGAFALLGSPRLTIDIDFVGDDVHPAPLHKTVMQIAQELKIHIEPVPLDRFIPLPKGNENECRFPGGVTAAIAAPQGAEPPVEAPAETLRRSEGLRRALMTPYQRTGDSRPLRRGLIDVACVDRNGDRKLDFPNCLSWRQPGSNEVCTRATDAFPGSSSKCKCDRGFTVPIDVPPATIEVTKTANRSTVDEPGGAVTYTMSVYNSGVDPNNPFTLQSLVDDKFGNLNGKGTCSVPQNIKASTTYSCTFTATVSGNAGASHTNVVEGRGIDSRSNAASDTDDETVRILGKAPSIVVTKTANPTQVLEPGANVSYTVTVRNTSVSSDPVTITSLGDDKFGNLAGKGTCSVPQTIAASTTYSCTFTATVSGLINSAG